MSTDHFRLLVIDDDDLIHQCIRISLPKNWNMLALKGLKDAKDLRFDAAFVDMHINTTNRPDGGRIITEIAKTHPGTEIIAMSGDLSRTTMELGISSGATRFLAKPLCVDELHLTLSKIEALLKLRTSSTNIKTGMKTWIGYGEASQNLQKRIANLRGEKSPILIEGDSGTGKEIIANLIHQQECDEQRPFIPINVAAIPDNLFESEFFGHNKGSFTGATQNKIGLIEAANGGDLFLDEIEALPKAHQAKLLRFLESGEIRKVGSKETLHIDCRIIAATNRNLEEMVEKGEFREDLLWRLNGQKIDIPPLKDRKDDIPLLARYFTEKMRPTRKKEWTEDGIEAMKDYNWPGNVRELKRVCEQIVLQSPLPIIRREDVKVLLRPNMKIENQEDISLDKGLSALIAQYEANVIRAGLNREKDVDATAKLLGISRSSLYKKIKDHHIDM